MIHAKDVPALVNKRMLLAAEIANAERRLASLRASLESIDGAIVSFVVGRHKGREGVKDRSQGISRAILDALRQAAAAITVDEIAAQIAATRGVTVTRELSREIAVALRRRKDGLIVRDGEGWRIS
jgi:hypothetical protein